MRDLFPDELLLIEPVAQALENVVRIEPEVVQQIVAAEPVAVVREPRIGLDEVAARSRVNVEEAGVGNTHVGRAGANDHRDGLGSAALS
ncbi:hypothetical protein D9M68_836460 [compost metagenome]